MSSDASGHGDRGQHGSAALLVVALQAVALVVCVAVLEVAALLAAVARADAGAELAALAAATSLGAGRPDPAAAAADIAARNGVTLVSCACGGVPVAVEVTARNRSPSGLGPRIVRRRARATLAQPP